MKSKFLIIITAASLMAFPTVNFGQVTLGTAASKFVLFTSSGAVGDNASAHSHLTGDVGTVTAGPMVGFGNVNGIMHPGADATTTACGIDLLATIAQINSLPATLVGPLSLGSGGSITPGVWSIPGNATQTLDLFIDAQNDPNAQFIIKVAGTFSANTLSRVKLINGALACNVFWKIDGAVTMAASSTMRGNVITGGAVLMGSGDSLEGRMFVTPAGAITIDGITAFTPIGCGSPVLTGPASPPLGSLECYSIFTGIGALDGNLSTTSIGDVGNAGGGTVTGWTAGNVTGTLHGTGDPSTMLAATDLTTLYNTLNAMTVDIPLEFPVQFGRNLVLTPHVYLLNSAINGPATLTDSLYLDAQGNANAVFVFKVINGALSTSVNARVKLINGAQSKNVFWMVDGAVSIGNNSIFRGTVIVSSGAFSIVSTGITFDGRALAQNGAITTAGLAVAIPSGIAGPAGIITGTASVCKGQKGVAYSVSVISGASGYTWTLPSGATITTGANTNSITVDFSSTAVSGNITVQGTGGCSNGTVSANFFVTVNSLPIVVANANPAAVCAGSSTTLTGGGATSYVWTGGVTDGISFIPTSTNTYTVTGTDANSCSNTATTTVTFNSLPVVTANANPTTICAGSSATLTGGGAISYVWTGGVTDGISFMPTSTNTYTVTGTDANSCSNTATTTITVNSLPIVIATANPTTICVGSSATLTGGGATSYVWTGGVTDGISFVPTSTNTYTVTGTDANTCSNTATATVTVISSPTITANANATTVCTGTSVTLTGGGGTSYVWSGGVTDGIGFVPTATNTYTVTGTIGSSCSNTATITVNVVSSLVVVANASSSTICAGTSVTLTGSGATSYVWSGGVTNGIGFVPTVTNTYTVTGTVSGTCFGTATVTVNVISSPTITANASATTVCTGTSVTLTGGGATSYVWSGGIVNGIGFVPTATNTYTVTGTISGSCSGTATVTVNVISSPTITANASATTVCTGTSVTLTGGGATSYVWSGGVTNGIGFVPTATNTYTVTGTISGSCSGTATTTIVVNAVPVAVASSNSPICAGASINLTAQTVSGGTYSWVGPNGFASASQNPVITSATSANAGIYSLTASSNACTSVPATLSIVINDCDSIDFFIPEGFSPNGDGTNDVVVIRGILNYPNNTIQIFNRWGNKVFDASPYKNTWDGRSAFGVRVGGDELPVGTYFYILDLGNDTPVYKGTFYLNR